jgi:hypothetical protein
MDREKCFTDGICGSFAVKTRPRTMTALGDWYLDMPQRKFLIGIRVIGKSARSEIPVLITIGALLCGPYL